MFRPHSQDTPLSSHTCSSKLCLEEHTRTVSCAFPDDPALLAGLQNGSNSDGERQVHVNGQQVTPNSSTLLRVLLGRRDRSISYRSQSAILYKDTIPCPSRAPNHLTLTLERTDVRACTHITDAWHGEAELAIYLLGRCTRASYTNTRTYPCAHSRAQIQREGEGEGEGEGERTQQARECVTPYPRSIDDFLLDALSKRHVCVRERGRNKRVTVRPSQYRRFPHRCSIQASCPLDRFLRCEPWWQVRTAHTYTNSN